MRTIRHTMLAMLAATAVFGAATDSFDVLNIGIGGAATALGQTVAADTGSAEGVFYNPATLGSLDGDLALLGSFNPYLGMALWSGAVVLRLPGVMTIAASGYGLIFTEPVIGDVMYSGDTGRILPSGDYVFSGSIALPIGSYLRLPFLIDAGVTARYAMERLDDLTISGIMADAGVIIAFTNIAERHSFAVGAYGRNLGIGLAGDITLPGAVTAGLKYSGRITKAFGVKAMFDATIFFNDTPKFDLGAEFDIFNVAFIRTGYMFGYDARGFTIGAGARIAVDAMKFRFDYSFVPLGDLGMHHALQLSAMFGNATPAPAVNDGRAAFDQGVAHLREARYREGADSFSTIPPNSPFYREAIEKLAFAESQTASRSYYESGERLLNDGNAIGAIDTWRQIKSGTEYFSRAQAAIVRAQERLKDAAESTAPTKSDEDIYIEAVTYAKAKDYRKAIELWGKIKPGAELYERAQNSIEKAKTRLSSGE
ncbi:MAG: hypothetical protein AABZ39_10655 [Spirochaetota bacterium]